MEKLQPGDKLIVSEFSRLGRSLGQIIRLVDELVRRKIELIVVKENILIDRETEHSKQGLAAARPKGSLGKSRLDRKEEEIEMLISKGVSKTSIAKIMDISRTALLLFMKNRNLG